MVEKQVQITIHLGTGQEGELRRMALEAIAATQGYTWNGKPSIGRWLVAQADQWINTIYSSIKEQKGR